MTAIESRYFLIDPATVKLTISPVSGENDNRLALLARFRIVEACHGLNRTRSFRWIHNMLARTQLGLPFGLVFRSTSFVEVWIYRLMTDVGRSV
jgi:hypothetical protein